MEAIAGLSQCFFSPLLYATVPVLVFIKQVKILLHPASSMVISYITMS